MTEIETAGTAEPALGATMTAIETGIALAAIYTKNPAAPPPPQPGENEQGNDNTSAMASLRKDSE